MTGTFARCELSEARVSCAVLREAGAENRWPTHPFWTAAGRLIRRRVAPRASKRMKEQVRKMTRRSAGRRLPQLSEKLGTYLTGWKAYRSEERRVGKECRSRWS